MFENPFQPESKKAKKSLFNRNKKAGQFVSVKTMEKIEKSFPTVEYHGLRIRKEQVEFFKDLEKLIEQIILRKEEAHYQIIAKKSRAEVLKDELGKLVKECELDSIGNIVRLTLRQLDYLNQLPASITNLIKLKQLEIIDCKEFRTLPENLGQLNRLEGMVLNGTIMRELPSSFGHLKKLEGLYVYNHRHALKLPETFGRLKSLKELRFSSIYNEPGIFGLYELPENFGELSGLEILSIEGGGLKVLPDSFGQLSNLKTLSLQRNRFTDFPQPICDLPNLETLECTKDTIEKISRIGGLPKLKELRLHSNLIKKIGSFDGLAKLEKLDLSGNELATLPPSLAQLKGLKLLLLSLNKFKKFPAIVCELENLEDLAIIENEFMKFPLMLHNLKKLKTLAFGPKSRKGIIDNVKLNLMDWQVKQLLPKVEIYS